MQTAQLEAGGIVDETTPLLIRPASVLSPPDSGIPPSYFTNGLVKPALDPGSVPWTERLPAFAPVKSIARYVKDGIDTLDPFSPRHLQTAIRSIPAVILGSLLNILDGVSYGMILFPATGVFTGLGPMGVSMFFVSAVVAQAVFTFGGSGFAGGNGSMMIEIVVSTSPRFRSS
jgi:SulP family sulfate permease